MNTHVIELPDGRELAYSEAGAPEGTPVLAFHGTPGSRRQVLFPQADEVAQRAGVRLIAPDRPGYGHSTFHPGRTLGDWSADVDALADHLGVDRFAVVGISGGGPHALVCAALLPSRVRRAGIVSGIAPVLSVEDTEGMMRTNQILASLARRSEHAVLPMTSLTSSTARRWPDRMLKAMTSQLPPSDVAILQRPAILAAFVDDARRSSRTAGRAAAQDMTLFVRPWGFELADITVPVDFWQGDADRNVPASHARRQAALVPGATLHEFPGEGHLLVIDRLDEILGVVAHD
jgi:pimeloyl-ACP methyl ester carboxylesterase